MQGSDAASGRRAGQQYAAAQIVVGDPVHVAHGFGDVVEQDLTDPGAPFGVLGAEVGEPAVVGPQPGEPAGEVLGARRQADQPADREERRDGVGIQHLCDDAVRFEQPASAPSCPSCGWRPRTQVAEGMHVAVGPGVESSWYGDSR